MPDPITENIILRWNPPHSGSGPGEMWFLRCIHPDGSYYGEIRVRIQGKLISTSVQGTISASQRHIICEWVQSLMQLDPSDRLPSGSWNGLIAIGPIANPEIVLKYSTTYCPNADVADLLQRLIALLQPHMDKAASDLKQLIRKREHS